MNPSCPAIQVKDVKFELHAENSCNSNCCFPKKKNTTDIKISKI